MKKVAIISPSYFYNIWNSHGRSTFSMAYGLAAKGHNVSVFTFTPEPETYKQQDGQVSVYFVGGVVDPKTQAKSLPFADIKTWNDRLLPLLLCEKFDVIILNSWYGWHAAKTYGSAKIISIIPFLYTFSGWLKPLQQFGLEDEIKAIEADCIVNTNVLVTHTKKYAEKLAAYSNRPVYVIPNCHLDINNMQYQPVQKQRNQICFVGKFNREKCLERIIRILPELPEVKLIIASIEKQVGYLSTLEKLAKQLDVDHNICFLDWRKTQDIKELYRESTLAIVPSNFEPYGYSALDPMSLGTPVVVSEWSMLGDYTGEDAVFSQLKGFQEKVAQILTMPKISYEALIYKNREKIQQDLSELSITNLLETVLFDALS